MTTRRWGFKVRWDYTATRVKLCVGDVFNFDGRPALLIGMHGRSSCRYLFKWDYLFKWTR